MGTIRQPIKINGKLERSMMLTSNKRNKHYNLMFEKSGLILSISFASGWLDKEKKINFRLRKDNINNWIFIETIFLQILSYIAIEKG
jgi:hypothetical protein